MHPLEGTIQPAMALKWKILNNILQKKMNFSSSLLAGTDRLASSWSPSPIKGQVILTVLVSQMKSSGRGT